MSALLDIFVALVFIYLIFSIVVSGVQEWWAQFFGHRGDFLRLGMQRLIGDDAIFVRVIQHPLVGALYRDRAARGKPPSYVESGNFALAFADVVLRRASVMNGTATDALQIPPTTLDYENLHRAVSKLRLQHSAAALAVLPIMERSGGDLEVAMKGIEQWFDNGMDRVSGWYKAHSQRRLFMWGLVLAAVCNVDSIAIFQALNRAPAATAQIAAMAASVANSKRIGDVDVSGLKDHDLSADDSRALLQAVLQQPLPALPIGYVCLGAIASTDAKAVGTDAAPTDVALRDTWHRCTAEIKGKASSLSFAGFLLQVLGWAMTALAGVLGAPYWFGLLGKVVNIRGAGPKPDSGKGAS